MIRIIVVLIGLTCAQLVKSQDCARAISDISSTCLEYLNDVDTDVCDPTYDCNAELEAAVSACRMIDLNSTQEAILSQYNAVCSPACIAAQAAVDEDCEAEDGDLASICRGACGTLIPATFDACPQNEDTINFYNQLCGSGSMVVTSGITLLFAALCALVF